MLNFPNAPADGEISAQPNGVQYQWNDTLSRWDSLSGKLPAVAGTVVQKQTFETGEFSEGTNLIPGDDTIPQISEGSLAMTLAFTPKYATSELLIEVSAMIAYTPAFAQQTVALFRDSEANALACNSNLNSNSNAGGSTSFLHRTPAGSTQTQTFTVRHGGNIGGTSQFNGWSNGRKFGGASSSSITITEIQPNAVTPEPLQPSIAQLIDVRDGTQHFSNTTNWPTGDTIPQITHGTEAYSQVITPTQVGSIIKVDMYACSISGNNSLAWGFGLFRNSEADAVACTGGLCGANNDRKNASFTYLHTVTSLAPITFSYRFGSNLNVTLNGDGSGARIYGGKAASGMTITEIIPTAPQGQPTTGPQQAWAFINGATGAVSLQNPVGIQINGVRAGTGVYNWTFSTPLSNDQYSVMASRADGENVGTGVIVQTVNGFTTRTRNSSNTTADGGHYVLVVFQP